MDFLTNEKRRPYLIGAALVLFMAIALVLRMIPALFIPPQGFLLSSGADVWYTMRQIEVMVAHFPQYNWFDPMTAYPVGKTIDWGPLYPFLAAALSLALGASSRAGIINTAGWIAPLMAALLVPVTYQMGKMIWDWKAGVVAAGFISVFSYAYFYLSAYGWVDHNTAEAFFVSLFFLAYLAALGYTRRHPAGFASPKTFGIPVLLSCLAGFLYFLGYLTAPTVLLALIIIGIYTLIQFIVDFTTRARSEYLLIVNCLAFSCIAILEALFGFHAEGLSIIAYSMGHIYVILGLIAGTILLYGIAIAFEKNRMLYFLSLAGMTVCGSALVLILPALQAIREQAISLIITTSAYSIAIRETQAWTLSAAFDTFNLSLILLAGGVVIVAWHVAKKRQSGQIFLLIWLAVTLALTIPHQRFLLYLTAPVALTAAICTTETIRLSWDNWADRILAKFSPPGNQLEPGEQTNQTGRKERKPKKAARQSVRTEPVTILKRMTLAGVIIITILVFVLSVGQDYSYVVNTPGNGFSKDWSETLGWMKSSTPQTGVDYFGAYDQKTFVYPNTSYGILAPWEEGHRITFFAERIPITNAFQNNLNGNSGAAAYYLSGNETTANAILSGLKGRYVVTDLETATDTFPSLIPWMTGSADIAPYIHWFFVPDSSAPSGLTKTHLLDDAYFQTMIVRLQVFDGSMTLPMTAQYTQYTVQQVPDSGDTATLGGLARVITGTRTVDVSNETGSAGTEPLGSVPGVTYSGTFSSLPYQPVKKVPALTHYRLVHESPTNISIKLYGSAKGSSLPDIRLVKVFEYVKGAHIPGEGIIELNLVTNTGRSFVYRQESSYGEFVVPYATEGSTTEVRATGPYHIAGTSRSITVTEADVLNGSTVLG